jgi:hypothetical protein
MNTLGGGASGFSDNCALLAIEAFVGVDESFVEVS